MNSRVRMFLLQCTCAIGLGLSIFAVGQLAPNSNPVVGQVTVDCDTVSQIPADECRDLVKLFEETNGDNWIQSSGWGVTDTPCSWYGITCTNGNVTKVDLFYNRLTGSLPQLSNLPELTELYLHRNIMTGSIPDLSVLTNLERLYLSQNQFSGSIPDFSALVNLKDLYLNDNQLSGSVPSLSGMVSLEKLWLHVNRLSGPIPSLTGLTNLDSLWLHSNSFSGPVPDDACGLSQLYLRYNMLQLREDCFGGSLSDAWTETQTLPPTDVQHVVNGHNSVTLSWVPIAYTIHGGYYEVVSSVGGGPFAPIARTSNKSTDTITLTNLISAEDYEFAIRTFTPGHGTPGFGDYQQNDLTSIPSEAVSAGLPELCATVSEIPQSECVALENFYFATNGPAWTMRGGWRLLNTPCGWHGITCADGHVTEIDLYNNNLGGTLPTLDGLPNLSILKLNGNRLSGAIPELVGLSSLEQVYLNGNQLSDVIPDALCGISELYLGYNLLTPRANCIGISQSDDWVSTQTIIPENIVIEAQIDASIKLSWAPITYTADGGYIEIFQAVSAAGPYVSVGQTANKAALSFVDETLVPGTVYYYILEVFTPAHGTIGSVDYQPNALRASTTALISTTAFLNLPPIADSLTVDTAVNSQASVNISGSDPEEEPITYSLLSQPSNGTILPAPPSLLLHTASAFSSQALITTTNRLIYTPNNDFIGSDSFTFIVNDGVSDSNIATVNINVNSGTPTPTPTQPTPTPVPTNTPTPTPTFTPTQTPTPTPTNTVAPEETLTPVASSTSTPTSTSTFTPTPTFTPTQTPTPTMTNTPLVTPTPTLSVTDALTVVPTDAPTGSPTAATPETATPETVTPETVTPTQTPSVTVEPGASPTVSIIITPDATTSPIDPSADNDTDGIKNIDEDVNNDGFYINDDTDGDGIPNYLDPDDDDDGTPTLVEGSGDVNGNGISDHLDNTISQPNNPLFLPFVTR